MHESVVQCEVMSRNRTQAHWEGLVRELIKLPRETEWIEFKENRADPAEIGEYISALSNAAAMVGKPAGYMLWGIEDTKHTVTGTTFKPEATKGAGNEDLLNWLARGISPRLDFHFAEAKIGGRRVVILEVPAASSTPIQFQGQEFIRIGSYRKKLKDFPEQARVLWRSFDRTPFEERIALDDLARDDVLQLLAYPTYFDLLRLPLPQTPDAILEAFASEDLVARSPTGRWMITNLGAILFAKQLTDFPTVGRKAVRVISYDGVNRVKTIKEQVGARGYAHGYASMITYITGLLPSNEVIEKAIRKTVPIYPELAVRELVANALIHQDFAVTGSGPMIEIFKDRMEITNPGQPLIMPDRFLDQPPRSRNEKLAALMRRFGICEERGSGIDKVVFEIEFYQLPAALFEVTGDSTRTVLFAHQSLSKMDKATRIRACYQHACLKYVSRETMTNASVRERFGIAEKNKATASRFIKEAVTAKLIAAQDPDAAPKMMRYIPYWAAVAVVD